MFLSTLGWIFKVSVVVIVTITGKNLFDEWVERIREEGRKEVREEARRAIEEIQKPVAEVEALVNLKKAELRALDDQKKAELDQKKVELGALDDQKNQLLGLIEDLSKETAKLRRLNSEIDEPRQELIRSIQGEIVEPILGPLLHVLKTSISSQQQTAAAGFSAVQETVSTLSDANVREVKLVTDMGKGLGKSIASSAAANANAASKIAYESTQAIRLLASRPSNSFHYTDNKRYTENRHHTENRQLTFRGGPTSSQGDSALVLRRS